jgi:hypothetical protein
MASDLSGRHAAAAAAHAGLTLVPGQRVLDLPTYSLGSIVAGQATSRPRPPVSQLPGSSAGTQASPGLTVLVELYTVRLDEGDTVKRELGELVKIPSNVGADLEDFSS